jgi:hypothetical protein
VFSDGRRPSGIEETSKSLPNARPHMAADMRVSAPIQVEYLFAAVAK